MVHFRKNILDLEICEMWKRIRLVFNSLVCGREKLVQHFYHYLFCKYLFLDQSENKKKNLYSITTSIRNSRIPFPLHNLKSSVRVTEKYDVANAAPLNCLQQVHKHLKDIY